MLRRLLALLLFLPVPALAQAIRGTVSDGASGAQLGAVEIRVRDRAGRLLLSAASDSSGEFALTVPPADGVRLDFARLGYQGATSELLFVRSGEVLDLQVRLTASAVPLEAITVLARRSVNQKVVEFYQRAALNRRLGQGKIWTRADLARNPRQPISQLLRSVPRRASCARSEVYVDGVPLSTTPATGLAALLPRSAPRVQELAQVVTAPDPQLRPDASGDVVDWLVQPEDVEGIEIYRDTEIPVQFNPDGELCQVTLIWRRGYGQGTVDFGTARKALVVVGLGVAIGFLVNMIH